MSWIYQHAYDEYYDFDKEVLSCPDTGNTSLDVRLTFNIETRTAYMTVAWHNDDGNTVDLTGDRRIEWSAAIEMLKADGVAVPDELLQR